MIRRLVLFSLLLVGLVGLASRSACSLLSAEEISRPPRTSVDVAQGTLGVVVSDTDLASDVGRNILAQGGNAVDAAIGVAFALEVTWPEAGNIGGGGFMMVAPPDKDVTCINYRETSPANVNQLSFANWNERHHIRMAGVPGTVRGMEFAHQRYGKLPWKDIISPSIALARDGILVDPYLAYSLNSVLSLDEIQKLPRFAEFRRVYGHADGRLWQTGEKLVQPDLAETLSLIAEQGAKVFYEGILAEKLASAAKRGGGLITVKDLKAYTAQAIPAMQVDFGPYTVYGAPLPSSGGTTVLSNLQMLAALDFPGPSEEFWSVEQVHLLTEVMRRGFRDRAAWLGDTDFVTVPSYLTSTDHARELASTIDYRRATKSADIAGEIALAEGPYESSETTHFSVIDKDGLAVSNTYTLEGTFGCRIVVPGTGIVLNNEMGDFNWYPGYTDREGQIGTPPNLIEPGKRMLSSQSPTIVRQGGKAKLVIGSPGGRTIINTVTEILTQTLILDRSLEQAIEGPRFHHQWFPDVIRLEAASNGLFEEMKPKLESMGHQTQLQEGTRQGSANGIIVNLDSGVAQGVADWRRGAAARAVE